jgi:hypothetical protein
MLSGAQPKLFALHAIGDAEISIRIRFSAESPLSMTLSRRVTVSKTSRSRALSPLAQPPH